MSQPVTTAWLDYIDARRRMIHEWHEQNISAVDIAIRIELDVESVERIIGQLIDPPLPGCAREVVARLERRVADLEREVHRSAPPPDRAPVESEYRSLRLHGAVELCGCQYWHDTPCPGVAHNPRCDHAPKAGP